MKSTLDLLNELRTMAKRLSSTKDDAGEDRTHMAVGLATEACEVLGIEKKHRYQEHGPLWAESRIPAEVGDTLFYLLGYLDAVDLDIRDCIVAVLAKLRYRYPTGEFRPEDTLYRDKDGEQAAVMGAIARDREERV